MKNLTKGIAAVGALAMLTGVGACGSNTADDKGHVYFLNNKPEVVNQWNELAEMYTKQTGVKVDIQSATSGSYESTLSSELAKNNAPTMFGIGGFDSNPHIECSRVTPPPNEASATREHYCHKNLPRPSVSQRLATAAHAATELSDGLLGQVA